MTPKPQEQVKVQMGQKNKYPDLSESRNDGEKVVISGMSGLFPQSNNIKELSEILYNKVNPITITSRWNFNHPEAVNFIGEAPDAYSFDAQFFMINFYMAEVMDPLGRKILEQAYQAIYDAGLSPEHLSSKKIGVYIGTGYSEGQATQLIYSSSSKRGLMISGCSRAKLANRISYWLNVRGPSVAMDGGSCSAIAALERAYYDMRSGQIDGAIVGGSNLCLHPQGSVHYGRIFPLSKDGKVQAFDQNADGTVRSDAISVLFLQKEKDALRIYGELIYVKCEYTNVVAEKDTKETQSLYRSSESRINFLEKFYEEANIPPQLVEYVEAFGTGVAKADKIELDVISKVFCKERNEPLAVGSVISNIGFSDASSGMNGIIKVLLGYQTGVLAGNLHCETSRQDIPDLQENRMRILTDHHPCSPNFAAVNNISYTGVNSHVLLHGHYKPKDFDRYMSDIPHLVAVSGRTDSATKKIIDDLKSRPIDPEELALLYNIHEKRISGHLSRGYCILDTDEKQNTVCLEENVEYFDDSRRPLWFVYSGMGSQWVGMGIHLMRIPVFASAIKRCHETLKSNGIDIINIITSKDKDIFSNILHSFVGIAAIQVALTDVVKELGLVPDKIIGHSVGEIGCAYADGCLTAEEMMLAAYWRGVASIRTPLIKGSLVAVGLGYKQMVSMCPPGIYVACHNGPQSCTLSGPSEEMIKFVTDLASKNIFVREVPCSNIAYHSKYIAPAGPWMLNALKEVIKTPQLRSDRWLSTSVPQDNWHEPIAKYSSAEYFTNNLLSPVYFEEVLKLVPANAVLVEIAPHGLLQAILNPSLPSTCLNISLTKRGHPENSLLLLKAAGKLYNVGYNLQIKNLYPKVEFPVSTGTPLLSHLVEWVHQEKWPIPEYNIDRRHNVASCVFPVSLYDENSYLKGHVINGHTLYPFAGALVAVWDTLAMTLGVSKKQLSVKFNDINLYNQLLISDQGHQDLSVILQRISGYFEVLYGNIIIMTGHVNALPANAIKTNHDLSEAAEESWLSSDNVYQLLNKRNYSYRNEFRSIQKINMSFTTAELKWNGNWVTFLDGLIQFNILRHKHCGVSQLIYVNKLVIGVNKHKQQLLNNNEVSFIAQYFSVGEETRCAGVTIKGTLFKDFPSSSHNYVLKYLKQTDVLNSLQQFTTARKYFTKRSVEYRKNVTLESTEVCDYSALKWVEAPEFKKPAGLGVNVTVHYAALNKCDVDIANGTIFNAEKNMFQATSYGMDFSGVIEDSGQRVMGVVRNGAISRKLFVQPELMWPVPSYWTLEEAATVPLPYLHALYCLKIRHQLCEGTSLLVTGGAGALGQAVISIALAHGCEVFTTVSDMKKKQFLCKQYHQLKYENVFSLHNSNFRDKVLIKTRGIGCNVVINCIQGPQKEAAIQCVAAIGVIIDVVRIQTREIYALRMAFLDNDRSYMTVDVMSLFKCDRQAEIKKLQILLGEGIRKGYVRPLSSVTYAPGDVSRAFRLLSEKRHRGRVLLSLCEFIPKVQPRLFCSAEQFHWIICDTETFGLLWAEKLISCGARKLVFSGFHTSIIFDLKIRDWKKDGILITIISKIPIEDKDISKLGTIEGVYVIYANIKAEETVIPVNDLNKVLKQFNVSNKYFAVISGTENAGMQECIDRAANKLPATFLHLPVLKELKSMGTVSYNMSKWRGAIDIIERALLSGKTVLTAYLEELTDSSRQILRHSLGVDLRVSKESDDYVTLRELGLGFDKLQGIAFVLRKTDNLHLSVDEISNLTVKQLRTLEHKQKENHIKKQSSLAPFFSHICTDEVSSCAEMVFLPTRTFRDFMRVEEFDVRDPFLCIIPGLEGNYERFSDMCKLLKLNAVVLQSRLNGLYENIEETAKRCATILLKKMNLRSNFNLLGYESGVLVALEVASILEDHGLTGKIFCIGFAPDEFQMYLEEQLSDANSEESLQDEIIRHMANIMGYTYEDTDNIILKSLSWEQKINFCIKKLKGKVDYTQQYLQENIETAYSKIKQAKSYKVKQRALKSQIILLKAKDELQTPVFPNTIQLNSQQEVIVYKLNVPLALVVKDQSCPTIINKHLDPSVLESFDNKNICDSYLNNIDLFFTQRAK